MNGQSEKDERDERNDDAYEHMRAEPPQYRTFGLFCDSSESVELVVALDEIAADAQSRLRLWSRTLEGVEVVTEYPSLDGLWQDGGYRVLLMAAPDEDVKREWEGQAKELVLAYFEASEKFDGGDVLAEFAEFDAEQLEQAVTDALNALGQFADQLPRSHFVNGEGGWTLLELITAINNLQWAQIAVDNDDLFETCEAEIENYFERIRTLLANEGTDAAQS
jgi:hypothetical protein